MEIKKRPSLLSIRDIERADNIAFASIRYMHTALRKYHDKETIQESFMNIFDVLGGLKIGKAKCDEYATIVKHMMLKHWPRIEAASGVDLIYEVSEQQWRRIEEMIIPEYRAMIEYIKNWVMQNIAFLKP